MVKWCWIWWRWDFIESALGNAVLVPIGDVGRVRPFVGEDEAMVMGNGDDGGVRAESTLVVVRALGWHVDAHVVRAIKGVQAAKLVIDVVVVGFFV